MLAQCAKLCVYKHKVCVQTKFPNCAAFKVGFELYNNFERPYTGAISVQTLEDPPEHSLISSALGRWP